MSQGIAGLTVKPVLHGNLLISLSLLYALLVFSFGGKLYTSTASYLLHSRAVLQNLLDRHNTSDYLLVVYDLPLSVSLDATSCTLRTDTQNV